MTLSSVAEGTGTFMVAMGDTVSLGLTQKFRQYWGYDDLVDYGSGAYTAGQYGGQILNTPLMVANPTSLAAFGALGFNSLGPPRRPGRAT